MNIQEAAKEYADGQYEPTDRGICIEKHRMILPLAQNGRNKKPLRFIETYVLHIK